MKKNIVTIIYLNGKEPQELRERLLLMDGVTIEKETNAVYSYGVKNIKREIPKEYVKEIKEIESAFGYVYF